MPFERFCPCPKCQGKGKHAANRLRKHKPPPLQIGSEAKYKGPLQIETVRQTKLSDHYTTSAKQLLRETPAPILPSMNQAEQRIVYNQGDIRGWSPENWSITRLNQAGFT
jgi:hypothetical protein